MAKTQVPKQGEIWIVTFEPQVRAEIMKTRPAVILSNDLINISSIKTVVPIRDYKPNHSLVAYYLEISPDKTNNLKKKSTIDCLQIKSFDISRFQKKIGNVGESLLDEIIEAVTLCIER
jgi:mRNA interferase MazF